eukprot:1673409-Pleurochrysis_carterae.AAC.2
MEMVKGTPRLRSAQLHRMRASRPLPSLKGWIETRPTCAAAAKPRASSSSRSLRALRESTNCLSACATSAAGMKCVAPQRVTPCPRRMQPASGAPRTSWRWMSQIIATESGLLTTLGSRTADRASLCWLEMSSSSSASAAFRVLLHSELTCLCSCISASFLTEEVCTSAASSNLAIDPTV